MSAGRDSSTYGLPQTHVVGQDRTPTSKQERDTFNLMRIQPLRDLFRSRERRFGNFVRRRARHELYST